MSNFKTFIICKEKYNKIFFSAESWTLVAIFKGEVNNLIGMPANTHLSGGVPFAVNEYKRLRDCFEIFYPFVSAMNHIPVMKHHPQDHSRMASTSMRSCHIVNINLFFNL